LSFQSRVIELMWSSKRITTQEGSGFYLNEV
jgi:hypothetical protein